MEIYNFTFSYGIKRAYPASFEKHQEQIRRIEDTLSKPPYNQLFLEIDDKVLEEIEIVFGPKMSEDGKNISYCVD